MTQPGILLPSGWVARHEQQERLRERHREHGSRQRQRSAIPRGSRFAAR